MTDTLTPNDRSILDEPSPEPTPDADAFIIDMTPGMTLGQMEDVEIAMGYPMSQASDAGRSEARLLRAMLYVRRKVIDPSYTFDQTADLPLSALNQFAAALSALMDPPSPQKP